MIYAVSYLLPLSCFVSLMSQGVASFATVLFAFVFLPLCEYALEKFGLSKRLGKKEAAPSKRYAVLCDWVIRANVIWVYLLVILFALSWANLLNASSLSGVELVLTLVGQVLSLGLVLGANGINVAHELGHRVSLFDQRIASALLLPSFYMHFTMEHNFGHHKHVATDKDPATARQGESLFAFWYRSSVYSYISAWSIQRKQLEKKQQPFLSRHNKLLVFTVIEAAYISVLLLSVGMWVSLLLVAAGIVGFLLLETVNYIEHYGLRRKHLDNGRYERVRAQHSWNANYLLGRWVLFELTLHSDHHYLARKPFYELEDIADAPSLPMGYPAAMLMALIPPLWFKTVDPLLADVQSTPL